MLTLEMALNLRNIGNISSCELRPSPIHDNAYTVVFVGAESQDGGVAELTDGQGNIITASLEKATSFARRAGFPADELKTLQHS